MDTRKPSLPFLIRVQKQFPENFWVNLELGNALLMQAPVEARLLPCCAGPAP